MTMKLNQVAGSIKYYVIESPLLEKYTLGNL